MDRQIKGELSIIKEKLREFNESEINKFDDHLTDFIYEDYKLENIHRYFNEIVSLLEKGVNVTLMPVPDLTVILDKVSKKRTLEIEELLSLKSLLLACKDISNRFSSLEHSPLIKDLALDIDPLDSIIERLTLTFNPDGTVLDTASSQLAKIRRELQSLIAAQKSLLNVAKMKYRSFLAMPDPVLKNGVETLAISSSYADKIPGIVIDRSKTSETLFILPYSLLESSNKIEKLHGDELAEIDRILTELSLGFADQLPILNRDYVSYNQLDDYISKTLYGRSYGGCIASLSTDTLSLHQLIHPLLDLTKAVANTVELGGNKNKILIISGPNAGGKSVLLKSVALACYMNQMGLFVACRENATLPLFDHVLILTGDSESLSGNLSSFSGHLKGLKEMYDEATSHSMVLVDEIGQGTSPKDGEAIGYAFIKHIEDIRGFGIFTTHYDEIKKLAIEDKNVSSGAMEFSQETLAPTFRFLQGAIGNSYAFEVALKTGFPPELITKAKEYKATQEKVDLEKMEQALTLKIQKNDALEKKLNDKLAAANALLEKRNNAIKALEEEKENIRKKADLKVEKEAQDRLNQLNEIWNQAKNKNLHFNEISKLKGDIKNIGKITTDNDSNGTKFTDFKVGDIVVYNNMTGTLESLSKNKAKFLFNGMTFTVPLNEIHKSKVQEMPTDLRSNNNIDSDLMHQAKRGSSKLNVIGLTVAEAIPMVDAFLDDALMAHRDKAIILHGMGTFALRNGIQAHLKRLKFVKSFREGNEAEGAMAVTVVNLK